MKLAGFKVPFTGTESKPALGRLDFDQKNSNKCGTWATNSVSNINNKGGFQGVVGGRLASGISAVPLFGDSVLHLGSAALKTCVAIIFGTGDLLAAACGKELNLANRTGLKHYTLNQAAGHLGKVVGGLVGTVSSFTLGVIHPASSVALCRALGLAKTPEKPGKLRQIATDTASFVKNHKVALGASAAVVAGLAIDDQYGYGVARQGAGYVADAADWAADKSYLKVGADKAYTNDWTCAARNWLPDMLFSDCEGAVTQKDAVVTEGESSASSAA